MFTLEKIAYVYGDVCVRRKKQRRKRQKTLVIELLFEYAKNSTLHGLRYIVDHGLNIAERFFWFLTVIASILLCSFYIYNVVHKWRTSPVIVTVNGRLSSVGSVCRDEQVGRLMLSVTLTHNNTMPPKMLIFNSSKSCAALHCARHPEILDDKSLYAQKFHWKHCPSIRNTVMFAHYCLVPFPSVMICPQMKVNPEAYNYTEKSQIFSENEDLRSGRDFIKFNHIDKLCDLPLELDRNDGNEFTDSSIVDDIVEAAPTDQNTFFMCKWHDSNYDLCERWFKKVITEEGVCYATNSLAAKDIFEDTVQTNYPYMDSNSRQLGWSLEEGYNYSSRKFYPRRGRVFGSAPDLQVILIIDPDKGDKSCNKIFTGFKIFLHHPADFPQLSNYYYAALKDQLSSVAISFHEFNSDSDLISYDTKIRQCYFPSDRKLRYFKIYTANNCLAECISNYTDEICKCVAFSMPHQNGTKICDPSKKWECLRNAKDIMATRERKVELGLSDKGCRCLPACNTVEYDAEILKTDFHIEDFYKEYLNDSNFNPNSSYSKAEFFYKKSQFVTMQRRELFGFTDLLANIGGLLGVFLGFSFLSLIEIFYFLTVRVGFILKRDLEEEKSKAKSKMGNHQGY